MKSIPYSFSHHNSLYFYVFYFYVFIFRKQKSNKFLLIKLYLILKNLIAIHQYSPILQGFVILRVIILLLIFLYTKRPHQNPYLNYPHVSNKIQKYFIYEFLIVHILINMARSLDMHCSENNLNAAGSYPQ